MLEMDFGQNVIKHCIAKMFPKKDFWDGEGDDFLPCGNWDRKIPNSAIEGECVKNYKRIYIISPLWD